MIRDITRPLGCSNGDFFGLRQQLLQQRSALRMAFAFRERLFVDCLTDSRNEKGGIFGCYVMGGGGKVDRQACSEGCECELHTPLNSENARYTRRDLRPPPRTPQIQPRPIPTRPPALPLPSHRKTLPIPPNPRIPPLFLQADLDVASSRIFWLYPKRWSRSPLSDRKAPSLPV